MQNRIAPMRKLITSDPYEPPAGAKRERWPAKWVSHADAPRAPFVTAYRRTFTLEKDQTIEIHVSADERYDLWLDGDRIGMGPERGDPLNWYFETYALPLKAGEHRLVARVWSLGEIAPMAQMSLRPGFICSPQRPEHAALLATGVAPWEVKLVHAFTFTHTGQWLKWVGPQNLVDPTKASGDDKPVAVGEPGMSAGVADAFEYDATHHLRPAMLPAMIERPRAMGIVRWAGDVSSWDTHLLPVRADKNDAAQQKQWEALVADEKEFTVPPNSMRRVIFDLGDYVCGYPALAASGGDDGRVRVNWAEALFVPPDGRNVKENRDEIEGKLFNGQGDEFQPAVARKRMEPLWWRCGRYVEAYVETKTQPMTIHELSITETRYPLEMEAAIRSSEPRFDAVVPIMLRGLQMCSHETYMDCPYYEQLMYVGDSRLEALTTFAITRDDRLPRKALLTFARSRLASDLTQSRFPSRRTQIIPPFSLWWVGMLHDYALWRGELPMIRELMPVARGVIESFLRNRRDDGLVDPPPGWNFYDWVPGWGGGVPLGKDAGAIGLVNWQLVYMLGRMKDLEAWCGETELAARADRLAKELAAKASAALWDEGRGLFSDDLERASHSEHSQCIALLGGYLDAARAKQIGASLLSDEKLARATIYFTHYLFEAYRQIGRVDKIFERLQLWFDLPKQGFRTTPESPEPTRSDCHAWGAHPIYHYFATLAGIRPAGVGFETVRVEPSLGPLKSAAGKLAHPKGFIEFDLNAEAGAQVRGTITLPDGVTGTFAAGGKTRDLKPGKQTI